MRSWYKSLPKIIFGTCPRVAPRVPLAPRSVGFFTNALGQAQIIFLTLRYLLFDRRIAPCSRVPLAPRSVGFFTNALGQAQIIFLTLRYLLFDLFDVTMC